MSKIGRKAIDITGLTVKVNGQEITYKGPKGSGTYLLPKELEAKMDGNRLTLLATAEAKNDRETNRIWGLHRALLFNTLRGAAAEFEKKIEINGLGFKATASGKKLVLKLGYSHEINFELPNNVAVEIDKSGQKLTFKSNDKELVGQVCSEIRAMREPEPYKGTGIKLASEVIARKAGKTKASA